MSQKEIHIFDKHILIGLFNRECVTFQSTPYLESYAIQYNKLLQYKCKIIKIKYGASFQMPDTHT